MAETSKSTTKEKAAKTKKESQEKLLNRELEDSFPASDPPSLGNVHLDKTRHMM